MSAANGVFAVVCCGPPNAPHDRQVILEYTRFGDDWHLMPPPGMARLALAGAPVEHQVHWPVHGDQIRLRCRDRACRFDEKRRLDRSYGETFPPFSVVFDGFSAAGKWEISARALVAHVWPSS